MKRSGTTLACVPPAQYSLQAKFLPPSLPLFLSLSFSLFSRYHLCSKSILAWKAIQ